MRAHRWMDRCDGVWLVKWDAHLYAYSSNERELLTRHQRLARRFGTLRDAWAWALCYGKPRCRPVRLTRHGRPL